MMKEHWVRVAPGMMAILVSCADRPAPLEHRTEVKGVATDGTGVATGESDLQIVSMEIHELDPPIVIGPPHRSVQWNESLEVKLAVDRRHYRKALRHHAPQVFIGDRAYPIFATDSESSPEIVFVMVHVPDWEATEDGAVVALKEDASPHSSARFSRDRVVDRREKP